MGIAIAALLVFVVEALIGRRERRRMMGSEVEENLVSESLHRIEQFDEDRFSEKEEEQGEVRRRLVEAARKQDEKLDEILRRLKRGSSGTQTGRV